MNKITLLAVLSFFIYACSGGKTEVSSPDKTINVIFTVNNENKPTYQIKVKDSVLLLPSVMGFRDLNGASLSSCLRFRGYRPIRRLLRP